jgi:hypothetical protein
MPIGGRKDRFPGLLSRRTGQADFPHPALRLMVHRLTGWLTAARALTKKKSPRSAK